MQPSHLSQVQEWDAKMFIQRGFARSSFQRGYFQYKDVRESRRPVPDYTARNRAANQKSTSYWFAESEGRPRLLSASFSTPLPSGLLPSESDDVRPPSRASSRPGTATERPGTAARARPVSSSAFADGMGILEEVNKALGVDAGGGGRGGRGFAMGGGREARRPKSAWKKRGDASDRDGADEEEDEFARHGYVDHVYRAGRAFNLEGQAKRVLEESHEKVRKKVALASEKYASAYDRERRQKKEEVGEGMLHAVHTQWARHDWTFTPVLVSLNDVLRTPMKYILLLKREFLAYGEGIRPLTHEEAQNLDSFRPRIALDQRVLSLLKARDIVEAGAVLSPLPIVTGDGGGSWEALRLLTDTRRRQLAINTKRAASPFPPPTLNRPTTAYPTRGTRRNSQRPLVEERSSSLRALSRGRPASVGGETAVCGPGEYGGADLFVRRRSIIEAHNDLRRLASAAGAAAIEWSTSLGVVMSPVGSVGAAEAKSQRVAGAMRRTMSGKSETALGSREVSGDEWEESEGGITEAAAEEEEVVENGEDEVNAAEAMSDEELLAILGVSSGDHKVLTIQEAIFQRGYDLQAAIAKREYEILHPPPPPSEEVVHQHEEMTCQGVESAEVLSSSPEIEPRPVHGEAPGYDAMAGDDEEGGSSRDSAGGGIRVITGQCVTHGGRPASDPITLASLVPDGTVAHIRSVDWVDALARRILESKLLSDAVDRSFMRPFLRLPIFIHQWLVRRFGLSKIAAQNLADLGASLEAHGQHYPFLEVFRQCANEVMAPARSFVLTGCNVMFRALSRLAAEEDDDSSLASGRPVPYVPAGPALDLASAVLRGAPSSLSESVAASVAEWSCEGRVGGVDGTWVSLESLLEAVVHTYNDMRCERAQEVRRAYDDLLFEISRGLPCDGDKGRPLGDAVRLHEMRQFAGEQFPDMSQVMWASALQTLIPSELLAEDAWINVDALLAIDSCFDLHGRAGRPPSGDHVLFVKSTKSRPILNGYDAPWRHCLAPPDTKIVFGGGGQEPLMAMTSVPLSLASGPGEYIKSSMHRMAAAGARERIPIKPPRPSTAKIDTGRGSRPASSMRRPRSALPAVGDAPVGLMERALHRDGGPAVGWEPSGGSGMGDSMLKMMHRSGMIRSESFASFASEGGGSDASSDVQTPGPGPNSDTTPTVTGPMHAGASRLEK